LKSGASCWSFVQGFVRGVGGEPDDEHAESVNQGHHCANAGVIAAEETHQRTSRKQPGGGGETADIVSDAAAGGADARGEQFRQIEWQPTKEQCGDEALREEQRQEDGLHRFGEQEQPAGDGGAAKTDEEVGEATSDEAGELRAAEAAEDSADGPPGLRGGFVVGVFFSGDEFGPGENPFARSPRADERD
jgi:hypothetical protein